MSLVHFEDIKIGIVGLGYVGLPLAVYLGRHFPVIGFDADQDRIEQLQRSIDWTYEVAVEELQSAKLLSFTSDQGVLETANFYIVAVPTPISAAFQPDLRAIETASKIVGRQLKKGDIVVYESTVYPGLTEEICVPILTKYSGLIFNQEFYVGYSPERVNPGDKKHRLPDIVKITSGSTPEAADLVDKVYSCIVTAGTYKVSSIRIAEASKIIENIQRDVNIALINELAQLFKKLNLETREVFAAAATKWNFHPYAPGLVGGHCIGVDPYYLTYKAQSLGFHPEMILAGRRINDGMAAWIALDVVKAMLKNEIELASARVLVVGLTFKENTPDIRNTKVFDLICELEDLVSEVAVFDPLADGRSVQKEYGLKVLPTLPNEKFDCVVLAVRHDEIMALGAERLRGLLLPNGLLYDLKQVLPATESDARL